MTLVLFALSSLYGILALFCMRMAGSNLGRALVLFVVAGGVLGVGYFAAGYGWMSGLVLGLIGAITVVVVGVRSAATRED